MKTFKLEFKGYYRECNKDSLPHEAGIYCVYTCKYDTYNKTVNNLKLIYIGESENINERHKDNTHEHYEDFISYLYEDAILCYSYSLIKNEDDRKRCEAALIYEMQPPINTQCKESFDYEDTQIITSGRNAQLKKIILVKSE